MLQKQTVPRGFKQVTFLAKVEYMPEDWLFESIGSLGQTVGGGTPDTTKKDYWNGNIPWAVPSDITALNSSFISNTGRKITEEGLENSSAKIIPAGAILLTSRATIGECAINTIPMATNQGFQSLICNDSHDNLFMFYALKFNKSKLIRLAYGTTFLEISKTEIRKVKLAIPSKPEQRKIASILSKVDDLIQKTDEIIERTRRLKKGLMQRLLTKGIGHTKFKKTEFGLFPESWKIIPLEAGCKSGKGSFSMGPFGSDIKTTNFVSSGVPVIRGVNLTVQPFYEDEFVFVTKEKAGELRSANAFPGDVLFTHRGTLGQVGVIPLNSRYKRYVISQSQMKCTCDTSILRPMFVFLFFISELGQKTIFNHSTKSGVPHIVQPLTSLRKFPIFLPPIEEQDKIVSILTNLDSRITHQNSEKSCLEKLKKGLMQKLLTGQIRVKV